MNRLSNFKVDQEVGGNQRSTSSPKLAILHCEHHNEFAGLFTRLRSVSPSLLPDSLPPKVLIKPNLCDLVSWEAGVTTDPAWLPVLAHELRAIRPDVQILVVESDAVSAYKTLRSCDETYDRLGYREIARQNRIELVNLTNAESIQISLEDIPKPILIPELFLEEFFFISIANLKVHGYERMTAILKNSLGLLPDQDISPFHPYLARLISYLHRLSPPDLCIVDGRIGLEGNGPIAGDPVRMNSVIFSNDALSADAAACRLMMISPKEVPHLRQTAKDLGRKLPEISLPPDIQPRFFAFNGADHQAIRLKFAIRRILASSDLFIGRWLGRFLRFKHDPLKFLSETIPKLIRRLHAS